MTQDECETLVKKLEQEALAHPARYRRKLGALALLGYAYIAGIVVLLVGGTVLLGWLATISTAILLLMKKIGWTLLVLTFVVLRAMWVKLDPPQGRPLTKARYPKLFQVIEDVRTKAKAPRLSRVLLTDDFNAAVAQRPRFGVFGGTKNYLILGLPLMQALSPTEFKAVLAHEFGHLSGAHGQFGAWIYRLREGWTRLLDALQQNEHWGSLLFTKFFRWYAPLFSAYSFVQARQQEYEADRVAVEAVGSASAASALLRVNVQGDFIEQTFWPSVFKRADRDPTPTVSPFSMLGFALKQQTPATAAERWLSSSLSRRTGYDDTHPCLSDRLRAMGVAPYVPPPLSANAADVLLESTAETLQQEMDERWRMGVKPWWDERHQYVNNAYSRLAALESKTESALTEEELWDRARFTEEFGSGDTALALYTRILTRNDQHIGALWRYGQMLIDRDDPKGIEQMLAAAKLDRDLEEQACADIVVFHRRHGREADAKLYERRYWEIKELGELSRRERSVVRTSDSLIEHGLDATAIADLIEELDKLGGIRRALLVRKQVLHDTSTPLYVLGVYSDVPWWKLTTSARESALVARISQECRFPGETLILSLRTHKHFRKAFRKVRASQLYERA